MNFDPEQFENLKRRAEEDYRQDIAAIERIQRRFLAQAGSATAIHSFPSAAPITENGETQPAYSRIEPAPVSASRPDELGNSLRAMFSTGR